jgi:GST-like protein
MKRIYGVIDKRLSEAPHLAGEYSIADKATYPWPRPHNWPGQKLEDFPHLKKWYDAIEARPRGAAWMRGDEGAARETAVGGPDPKSWEILFGKQQFEKR